MLGKEAELCEQLVAIAGDYLLYSGTRAEYPTYPTYPTEYPTAATINQPPIRPGSDPQQTPGNRRRVRRAFGVPRLVCARGRGPLSPRSRAVASSERRVRWRLNSNSVVPGT